MRVKEVHALLLKNPDHIERAECTAVSPPACHRVIYIRYADNAGDNIDLVARLARRIALTIIALMVVESCPLNPVIDLRAL